MPLLIHVLTSIVKVRTWINNESGDSSTPWYQLCHVKAETKWTLFRRWHFQINFLEWKCMNIHYKIPLKFVPHGPINNIPALVQIMAWRRPGDKPLSGPMMVRLPTHICVTRPQWLKGPVKESYLDKFWIDALLIFHSISFTMDCFLARWPPHPLAQLYRQFIKKVNVCVYYFSSDSTTM